MATPYVMGENDAACRECNDPQKDLVDPAVKGTTTVLKSVSKSKDTVKRVVLTSSVAGWCTLKHQVVMELAKRLMITPACQSGIAVLCTISECVNT